MIGSIIGEKSIAEGDLPVVTVESGSVLPWALVARLAFKLLVLLACGGVPWLLIALARIYGWI